MYKLPPEPMPDPSLIQRQRLLLKRLASEVADRAAAERTLDDRRQKTTSRADREQQEAVAGAETDFKKQSASLEAEHRRRLDAVQAAYDAKLQAARVRMETHYRNYASRTNALGKAATQEHEESKWLAETLVESGDLKIRAEFELHRKAIEKNLNDLRQARLMADGLLQDHRHPPLPAIEEPPAPNDPPETLAVLAESFATARQVVEARFWHLRQMVEPFILGWVPIAVVMASAAAAGGYGAFRWGQDKGAESIAIWAGGSAAGALVLMLVIKLLARRRVPRASAALSQAFGEAMLAGTLCQNRARADRDRQSVELLARRDEELKKAERRMTLARREVARRNNVDGPRLRDRHSRRLADIRSKLNSEVAALGATHAQQTGALQAARDERLLAAADTFAAAMRDLDDLDRSERGIVEQHWKQTIAEIQAEAAQLQETMTRLCPPWTDPTWDHFQGRSEIPPAVSFGRIDAEISKLPGGLSSHPQMQIAGPTAFALPALLDLFDRGSLLIHAGKDPAATPQAIQLLQEGMPRLITTFPPGKVRFTIFDPVGLGQNFAGFMHLADHDEHLVGGKIWTDPKHIEQRLNDLTEHMETVIQKYLRTEYKTIRESTRRAGEAAEPYRFLIIADFPANLTESAAKRLASIAQSGARCGLYTLIASGLGDAKARPPSWLPMAALEQSSAVLAVKSSGWSWQDDELSKWTLSVEAPPPEDRLTAILHQVGAAAKDASRVQVSFDFVAPKADGVWSLDSADEVRVPLGRAGAKALQYITLGRGTAQHALIAGRTGSGKSTLLHVLITNLALWYSPDQVEMYLVDFKKGVEFKTYAAHVLPHARVVAVESEREFGLSVLRKLDAELTRRGQLFREAGVQDVAGYRKHLAATGGHGVLPRVLLIVDEFQEFFVEDDKLAQEASLLLDRLIRQGRAFGMHVVLGSQTLGGAYSIARSTIGQMAVRIALQCSEADSYLIMSEDNAAPRLLSRPGEAIYNDISGRIEGNSLFQIVWLPDEKRERYLQTVHDLARANGRPVPPPPIVFEGNIPGDLASNHLLAALLGGAAPAPSVPRAWLGEAISIKDPTAATFRRQSGSNLLIVGQQEDAAAAMLVSAAISLAAHGAARLAILDATPADVPHAAALESLAARLPSLARLFRPRDAAGAVGEVFAELQAREQADRHDAPPLFLFVSGLQRLRDLRKEDDFSFASSGEAPTSPAQQFAHILREGPPLGVHVVLWCDTATNVDRALDRNALREFDTRVLFQMSAADSTHMIDTPAASTLGRNRALLHSEETGIIEKFRPYAPADPAWLSDAIAKLSAPKGS